MDKQDVLLAVGGLVHDVVEVLHSGTFGHTYSTQMAVPLSGHVIACGGQK